MTNNARRSNETDWLFNHSSYAARRGMTSRYVSHVTKSCGYVGRFVAVVRMLLLNSARFASIPLQDPGLSTHLESIPQLVFNIECKWGGQGE